jgi:8-oxo-dGTP diphosphatase
MADAPADDGIRAAGAVVWRSSDRGREVALIHRPRYDDWSFPKGKLEPGEHVLLAAVREVAEETGLRPQSDGHAAFLVNDETDGLEWLPLPAARGRLSYPRDVVTLDEFAAGPVETVPLVLLRHASAGDKGAWSGDDLDRPLDARGAADADRLAELLACYGSFRVISSAAERCVATVRPYAVLAGAPVTIEPALTVRRAGDVATAASDVVKDLVAAGAPAIICAHGENLPPLLTAAAAALGEAPPDELRLPKAGFWVLHAAEGVLVAAERHDTSGR